MAGTVLTIGALISTTALAVGLGAVGAAALVGQRAAAAADAAALAAADAASGVIAGVPCERAGQVATAGGASLAACTTDGPVATVTVTIPSGALIAAASARAGPPP